MDFIVDLPKSAGCTQIWVIVDRFTKMAHFIPLAKNVGVEDLAKKFLQEIWRLHGVPEQIVSDHDSKFMSSFWQSLLALLAIRPGMSTAFHPQTDGQMEQVNQSLEQYLRMFCNYDQDDWYELLPLAEYAYNNSITSITEFTPFYTNYRFNPKMTWLKQADAKNPTTTYYAY